MEEYAVSSWDEFEIRLRDLEKRLDEEKGKPSSPFSEYLFRGQGNASWLLETTLDRFFSKPLSLLEYYRLAFMAHSRVESFIGAQWSIPTVKIYECWLKNHHLLTFYDFEAYEYLAYLRHHGFPSPMLDWTQSPYVAAFFAFRHIPNDVINVAIYAYQERPGVGKISSSDTSVIHKLGPYVSAHKRHFLQQSQYTFCTEIKDETLYYTKHQSIVDRNDKQQDLLWKFIVPVSERRTFLAHLHKMNINAFSLFGSEDSLIETIASSEIYVRGRDL